MVFFTCGNCNETLKKNKVDVHFMGKCRNAEYVSCVDCSTDFYGEDYQQHTTCISEAEKYGGKDYTPSNNANKGQKKQDVWIEKVQSVLDSTKTSDPKMRDVLENLVNYPNIPQKKQKFTNFLKSTFPRYRYMSGMFEDIWKLLENAKSELKSPQNDSVPANGMSSEVKQDENSANETDKTMKKKKKKRKATDDEILDDVEVETIRENKRRKREMGDDPEQENVARLNETLEEADKTAKDFNWDNLIRGVLEKKGEISLKKLRKKAISEFAACGRFMKSEDRVWKKLDKKLKGMKDIKVVNDKVSFINS